MIKKIPFIFLGLSFVILLTLQLHNIQSYPVKRGFDASGHIQYINIIKNEHRLPLANEGWELYQSPLYYFTASLFPSIEADRYLGIISWLVLLTISFFSFKKIFKETIYGAMGALLIGTLPMIIYEAPAIGNEFFSAVIMISAFSYYAVFYDRKKLLSHIFLGLLMGLALLSKATAWVLLFSIITAELCRYLLKKENIKNTAWISLLVALSVGSWFYIRNLVLFKNPFISSVDFPQFKFHQFPGYRDFGFFLNPTGFLKLDMFHSHFYSLWSGTYFSWFYDGQNAVVPVQEFSKIGAVLILMSIPLVLLSLNGFIQYLKKADKSKLIFILYPVLLFLSYVLYNFKLPYYSTVKAIFIMSLAFPWTYFCVKALILYKKYIIVITSYILLYVLVVLKNFWILEKWYQ